MEVLSPTQLLAISEDEKKDVLVLPSPTNNHIIPFRHEINKPEILPKIEKICFSCQAPSKYQCPKCSTLSCSLACVKSHKEKKKCDGERNVTAYVAVPDFKDKDFHSDFHFLEDVRRRIDVAQRGKKGQGLMHGHLPHNLYRLQMAARLRKTDLQILPLLFVKRKRSTTYFRYSDKTIFWRLEWEFPHIGFTCNEERVDENMVLGECLDKYLKEESLELNSELAYYHSLSHQEIVVLLQDENCPCNVTQYHILEQSKTLKTNFRHKKIIEYPNFLVVSKIHLSCYKIVV